MFLKGGTAQNGVLALEHAEKEYKNDKFTAAERSRSGNMRSCPTRRAEEPSLLD